MKTLRKLSLQQKTVFTRDSSLKSCSGHIFIGIMHLYIEMIGTWNKEKVTSTIFSWKWVTTTTLPLQATNSECSYDFEMKFQGNELIAEIISVPPWPISPHYVSQQIAWSIRSLQQTWIWSMIQTCYVMLLSQYLSPSIWNMR